VHIGNSKYFTPCGGGFNKEKSFQFEQGKYELKIYSRNYLFSKAVDLIV